MDWQGGYIHVSACALGGQKRVPDPPELELQAVVSHLTWVLRTILRVSAEEESILCHLCNPWFGS